VLNDESTGRPARIATVFVPSFASVMIAIQTGSSQFHAAGLGLAGLWIAMACVLWVRYRRGGIAQLDVLSATGRTTAWSALAVLVLAIVIGWASLSVLGLLGIGVTCVAITWTAVMAGGEAPWRTATVTRTIQPETATEGEPLREQLHLEDVRIPAAMRLFATGRATRHGAISRYAVGSECNGATIDLECELGPTPRGEHDVPPLTLWLGDVLGLTRTAPVARGATRFIGLPRPAHIVAGELLGDGRDDAKSRDAVRMPTEGTFRIREYAPGDDARRIHWVRSLQTNQLVVRLPDEIPPADPCVQVVLDNHLAATDRFSCRAPDELLDAMVRVWLGLGRTLADAGTRVTLVTGVAKGDVYARVERPMHPRSGHEALRFAARVGWQPSVRLDTMLGRSSTRKLVISNRPRSIGNAALDASVVWVVVAHNDWTTPEPWPIPASPLKLPFPAGSAENRGSRRRAEQVRMGESWSDRAMFSQLCSFDWKVASGSFVARRDPGGNVMLQVIP